MTTQADALKPLKIDPQATAILLDVDGTLAPIVDRAFDARVPDTTRQTLAELAQSYGLVACVSGRRALDARRIVGLREIYYLGTHGAELLNPNEDEPQLDTELTAWAGHVKEFATTAFKDRLAEVGVQVERKDVIVALHWRMAPDEDRARTGLEIVAAAAQDEGLWTHWGRKVLEIRPPVEIGKGIGLGRLLVGHDLNSAIYVGDDSTDLDAFRSLHKLVDEGHLGYALTVGVLSDELPAALGAEADLLVDGTAGVRQLLSSL